MLLQAEADRLIALPKVVASGSTIDFPAAGERLAIELLSQDGREKFTADVGRGRIRLTKCSYQERDKAVTILVRLDVDGAPHTNPDGVEIGCPHLHVYREGYMDKWAIAAPADFTNTLDLALTLRQFLAYCRVDPVPQIQPSLT